jgi:hypothetical protein
MDIRRNSSVIATALLCAAAPGCTSLDTRGPARPVTPLPASFAAYYANGDHPDRVTVDEIEANNRYRVRAVRLQMNPDHQPIALTWYAPIAEGRRPLILVSPINGSDTNFVEGFARMFARQGYHAAIVRRHKFRYAKNQPVEQVEGYMRAVMIRYREVLDWLLSQPTVDPNRVGTFGISYGAIVNAALAGIDPRTQYHVLVMPGAPIAQVLHSSREHSIRNGWNRLRDDQELTDRELFDALSNSIRTDPSTLASHVPRDNVLMVIARFDQSVGTANTWTLWRALDGPKAVIVPLGHYSAVLALPFLRMSVMRFYREAFEADLPPTRNWTWTTVESLPSRETCRCIPTTHPVRFPIQQDNHPQ